MTSLGTEMAHVGGQTGPPGAYAVDMQTVARSIELKDGATVFIFKDGKMGMEDAKGRTVGMKAGLVMETKDGQRIVMFGNELARIDVIHAERRGGN